MPKHRSHGTAGHKRSLGAKRLQQREQAMLHAHAAVELCPRPDKRRYPDKQAAKQAIRTLALDARKTLHAYRCECGGFHIGHRRPALLTTTGGTPS